MFVKRTLWLLAALCLAGCSRQATDTTQPEKVFSREEFDALVVGKSEEEVIRAVGTPHKTSDGPDYRFFSYFKRTRDGVTDKVDADATIIFQDGKAERVSY